MRVARESAALEPPRNGAKRPVPTQQMQLPRRAAPATGDRPRAFCHHRFVTKKTETKLRADATRGVAQAQFDLARKIIDARGMKDREALEWIEKAAAQDHGDALVSLGWAFERGLGRAADLARAVECYERALAIGVTTMGTSGTPLRKHLAKTKKALEKSAL